MPTDTCRNCTTPFCGDGVMDDDEECDEGAAMPTATCRENCVVPICKFGLHVRTNSVFVTTRCSRVILYFSGFTGGDGIFDAETEECT